MGKRQAGHLHLERRRPGIRWIRSVDLRRPCPDSSTSSRPGDRHRAASSRRHSIWDDEELEFVHDYIQWLFPLSDASAFNPDAPILTDEDIAAFAAEPALRANLAKSFERILRFFGLTQDASGAVVEADNFASRIVDIWEAPNHNWLRITRILRSLTLLGLAPSALAFFVKLREFRIRVPLSSITSDTFLYWKTRSAGRVIEAIAARRG